MQYSAKVTRRLPFLFSVDGEVHLWDSRYATRSIMDWKVHERMAAFDLHNQTGVFAA